VTNCSHDFRRLFPRHVLDLMPTGRGEDELGFVCCKCGLGPGHVLPHIDGWRTLYKGNAGAFLEWPEDLKITDYEMENRMNGKLFITVRMEDQHEA
jgi:hypothetical protein